MDELFETRKRSTNPHTYSTTVNPQKAVPTVSRHRVLLHIAALLLCAQWLAGCGGGATETEATTEPAYAPPDSYTCTHFIDAATGVDTNNGLSPTNAWASANRAVAHMRSSLARPGDAICFKRGQRYEITDGRLGTSGTATKPVVIGAFGDPSETAPRLSSAIRLDDRPGWVNLGNGVFFWPTSQGGWNVSGLWRNNVWQRPATDQTLRDGDWYYAAGTGVYLRTPQHPSSGPLYLAVKYSIFSVHGLHHIAFRDLIFEYTGTAITGSPTIPGGTRPPAAIAYFSVKNCRFENAALGLMLLSDSIDGKTYENHHIDILNNEFENVRFAMRLGAMGNGPEHHRYVTIAENSIRNVAINGSYALNDTSEDIDAISLQNTTDLNVVGNRIEQGLKRGQGLVNLDGEPLFSSGISLWRHPDLILHRIRIERNYIRDMGAGAMIGAGPGDGMRQVRVVNNIVLRCGIGLKVNGTDSTRSYHVRFNTLFQNDVNLYAVSGGGQIVVNNFSIQPVQYHITISGSHLNSQLDYNVFAPNGRFFAENTNDPALSREYQNLLAFQLEGMYGWTFNAHSFAVNAPGFLKASPYAPEDFKLTQSSPARDKGIAIGMEDGDFGRRARPLADGVDIGAWTRHPSDG